MAHYHVCQQCGRSQKCYDPTCKVMPETCGDCRIRSKLVIVTTYTKGGVTVKQAKLTDLPMSVQNACIDQWSM